MKPIEEGCTAIVTGPSESPNTGKIVVVGLFLGQPELSVTPRGLAKFKHGDMLEVSQNIEYLNKDGDKSYHKMMTVQRLQRLDDTNENELVKQEIEEEV